MSWIGNLLGCFSSPYSKVVKNDEDTTVDPEITAWANRFSAPDFINNYSNDVGKIKDFARRVIGDLRDTISISRINIHLIAIHLQVLSATNPYLKTYLFNNLTNSNLAPQDRTYLARNLSHRGPEDT